MFVITGQSIARLIGMLTKISLTAFMNFAQF